MEFFILYGVIINFANPLYATAYGLNRLDCWIAFGIAMVLYLVLYAFKAIALLKMAKTCGKEKLIWCAFVPIASTYLMGEVSGGLQMGNVKIKHIGLYAMIAEIVVCVFSLMQYIPQSYVFNNESLYTIEVDAEQNAWVFVYTNLTPAWMARLITVSSVLSSVFSFVALIAFVFLHIAFFRSYAPQSYIWLTILCAVFPVDGILAFAFRNRTGVNYEAYMAARMLYLQKMQQAQYGQYRSNDPYNMNPYNRNGGEPPRTPDDPFGEYSSPSSSSSSSGADDPFGEFSENGKNVDPPSEEKKKSDSSDDHFS